MIPIIIHKKRAHSLFTMWRKKELQAIAFVIYIYIYIKVEVIMYKSYFLFFCWKLLFIWLWENYLLKPSA